MTPEELIRLRINLFAVIQKTERLALAQMTLAQKKRNAMYSDTEIKASEVEVRHARHMARGAAEEVLPALQELSKELVIT